MEMLVQNHDGCIELLPVCPAEWSEGEIREETRADIMNLCMVPLNMASPSVMCLS